MSKIEKLYVDSRDRQSTESQEDFSIYISPSREIKNLHSVYIDSMVFPNSLYVVQQGKNNKLYLNMRRYSASNPTTWVDQPFSVQIPEGNYNTQQILDSLPALIVSSYNSTYGNNPQTLSISMTYNTQNSVFSITVKSQYGRASSSEPSGDARDYLVIDDKNSTNYDNNFFDSLNYILGYDNMGYSYPTDITLYEDAPLQLTHSSTALHRLSGEQYLYLHSSIVSSSETSTQDSSTNDVLYKINLPAGYSEIIYSSTPHSASQIKVNTQSVISKIRFYLRDSRNEPVDLRGGEFSFILSLNYNDE